MHSQEDAVTLGTLSRKSQPWSYVCSVFSPTLFKIEGKDALRLPERDWVQQARRQGGEYIVPLLNEYRASWALIRRWAGQDEAIAQREFEIERLERLVWDAV